MRRSGPADERIIEEPNWQRTTPTRCRSHSPCSSSLRPYRPILDAKNEHVYVHRTRRQTGCYTLRDNPRLHQQPPAEVHTIHFVWHGGHDAREDGRGQGTRYQQGAHDGYWCEPGQENTNEEEEKRIRNALCKLTPRTILCYAWPSYTEMLGHTEHSKLVTSGLGHLQPTVAGATQQL